MYLALGQTKKALPDLTNVLSIRTDFEKARTQRGDIYIKQGEYELAEKDLSNNPEKRQLIQVCNFGFWNFFEKSEVFYLKKCLRRICFKIILDFN